MAAASESQAALLLRLGLDGRFGGVKFTLNLASTTFPFGSCSKLLSHNGEACYQNPFIPVNDGVSGMINHRVHNFFLASTARENHTGSMKSCFFSLILLAISLGGIPGTTRAAGPEPWKTIPSTHFIVMYSDDETLAQTVSERAESYYSIIASDLGYTRYQNFWLWDNRVKILIYPTANAFTTACNAPSWAVGRANYNAHEIASFRQSGEQFLSVLLPHEMAHLILADFIGQAHVPLWLTEGFAEWEQSKQRSSPPPPLLVRQFSLKDLVVMDIRTESDTARVSLFYTQCASVVGFLIKTYGGESFGAFCRGLRDGKTCEAALAAAYPGEITSLDSLEQKWRKSTFP